MEILNDNSGRKHFAALTFLVLLAGQAPLILLAAEGRTSAYNQCPSVAGRYYNFPEAVSTSIFSNEEYEAISCEDNEFCTLSRIFDEETGYYAIIELEQPSDEILVFRRGGDVIEKSARSGEFVCNGGSISLSEAEPGDGDSVRHLTQLTPAQDGSLIARVGMFTPGEGMNIDGPAPLVFSDSAWLKFEPVDESNRKDWAEPEGIRDYLGAAWMGLSTTTPGKTWQDFCKAVNHDGIYSSPARLELAWWYQESVWEFSHAWSDRLVRALHARGFEPNNTLAYMWLELAGKEHRRLLRGDTYSLDVSAAKSALEESMTLVEISAAKIMAREWQPGGCNETDSPGKIRTGDSMMAGEETAPRIDSPG